MKAPRSSNRVSNLETSFQRRHDASFAWRTRHDAMLSLGQLRGMWFMSSVNHAALVYDLTGQGRTLTPPAQMWTDFGILDWIPYTYFNGNVYLSRADEAGLDVSGIEAFIVASDQGLTAGGWFWPDDVTPAGNEDLMSKMGAAGNFSWYLRLLPAGNVQFGCSQNGAAMGTVNSATTLPSGQWNWVAGQYITAGPTLRVWVNDEYTDAATGLAFVFPSNGPFNIGSANNGANKYSGKAADCVYAGSATPRATMQSYYSLISPCYGHTIGG